jgi:hypothetical protein
MARPSSRQQLIDYCLRRLGFPVLEINIDDDQIEDLVDDAVQFFQERHFDGNIRTFLKYKITPEITAAAKTNKTITVSGATPAILYEQNNYVPIPDHILSIQQVYAQDNSVSSVSGNIFSMKYQLFLNDFYNFGSMEILNYYMIKSYMETLDWVLSNFKPVRWNKRENKLWIDTDWDQLSSGNYLIIDCYRMLDPNESTEIWNDVWMKRYLTALIKRQWGQNLIKFKNVALPGGVTLNGREIYEDGDNEIQQIMAEFQLAAELPPLDMIG